MCPGAGLRGPGKGRRGAGWCHHPGGDIQEKRAGLGRGPGLLGILHLLALRSHNWPGCGAGIF